MEIAEKRKMKILVVSESRWTKGVTYDIHIVGEALSNLGHQVYAFDPGTRVEYPNPSGTKKLLQGFSKPVDLISPTLLKPLLNPRRLRLTRILFENITNEWIRNQWVRSTLIEKEIDVVLLYSAHRLGPMVSRIAKQLDIPVVFRCIDQLYNLEKYKSLAYFLKFREYLTYRRINKYLALTPSYADYLCELGVRSNDISIVPFPIDTEMFYPSRNHEELTDLNLSKKELMNNLNIPTEFQDGFLAVFVGIFYEFGGLGMLLDSLKNYLNSDSKVRIILVGDGPAKLELQAKIQINGLNNRVFITGYQPFEVMPSYIAIADICLNVWPINARTENIFSAKIIQYLSCGKPVLSSALKGITRALPESETGVTYFDDIQTLVEKLEELSIKPDLVKQLGTLGRKYIEKNHSVKQIGLSVEKHLLELIHDR